MIDGIKLFSLLFVVIIAYSCKTNEEKPQGCSKLKTGRFEYRSPFGKGVIKIERNDSVQTEFESQTGMGVKLKITWPSDCEYHLSFISFTGLENKDIPKTVFPVIKSRIIKVTPNYYITRTSAGPGEVIRMDTMLIIK